MPKTVMSFATYSFWELGTWATPRWQRGQSFIILLSAFSHLLSKLQSMIQKIKPQTYADHIHFKLMLFSSFLTQKKKIISMFFSAGVPNRLSTNCQFPYSQRSQFPPSSKIMKSRGKNDFTSTYPFHKHTVRNLPCARY